LTRLFQFTATLALIVIAFVVVVAGNVAPAATLIGNGSFENTGSGWLSPWYFAVKSGGAGTVSQTSATSAHGSYSALVNVSQASQTSPWLVQLSQSRLVLASGQTYTVSFAAKASASRSLDVVLQQTASPYAVRLERRVGLSTAWQTLTIPYSATVSDSDASLHFNIAAATGTVWIDNVSIVSAPPTPRPSASTTPAPTAAPTATPSPTLVATPTRSSLTPTADATVQAGSPTTNFGAATTLISDGQPVTAAYMKFDLTALAGKSITTALLRMKVTNGSTSTQSVRLATGSAWTESSITYNNRPSLGAAFKTFAGGALGAWVEVDVKAGLPGKAGQVITLGIDSVGSDGYAFNSRDAPTDKVTLIVEAQGGGGATPPSTPAPSSGPTASPAPAPTVSPSAGKGVSLRPFAEYWGSNTAGMNSDFADMKAGKISWARMDLFKTASPNPAFDAAIQAAKSHGIRVVVVVHKTPPVNDLGTDADRAVYRAWLAEMVNRYKYHVKHWQIHNEPNLHYEWNIDDSSGSNQTQYVAAVHRYVSHLQDGFETVKANDPGATVLHAGLSEWTIERYMDVLVTTQAYRHFDVMAVHPYGYNADRVLSRFNSFKGKMNLNSTFATKPIWVTEIGFNTSWSNKAGFVSSEQQKADYLAQTLRRLDDAGARLPIFWYTLHENDTATGFGLTRKNKSTLQTEYLPAFYAYRDLSLSGP
jgi:Carbohydrate binding domain/Glycosyl hydrolase catalytic core